MDKEKNFTKDAIESTWGGKEYCDERLSRKWGRIFKMQSLIVIIVMMSMIRGIRWYLWSAPYPQENRVPSRTRYYVMPSTYSSMWLTGSAVLGPISGSIYTLGEVNGGESFLRKIDQNDQQVWIKMYTSNPAEVTLSITNNESILFYTENSNFPLLLINATTGGLFKSYINTSIKSDPLFTSIVVTSDNSAIYFNQASSNCAFWRFPFSTYTATCFTFTGWSKQLNSYKKLYFLLIYNFS